PRHREALRPQGRDQHHILGLLPDFKGCSATTWRHPPEATTKYRLVAASKFTRCSGWCSRPAASGRLNVVATTENTATQRCAYKIDLKRRELKSVDARSEMKPSSSTYPKFEYEKSIPAACLGQSIISGTRIFNAACN